MASVFAIYVIIGFVAIFAFGEALKPDIMQDISNKKDKDWMDYTLMVLFMIIAAMHIPIVFFVGKEAILIIVDELMRRSISTA